MAAVTGIGILLSGRFDGRCGIRRAGVGQCGKQLLDGRREFGIALQSDDGQRAMGLVHAGAGLLQLVAGRVRGVGSEALPGAFQRKVDFPLDPGQRTDV